MHHKVVLITGDGTGPELAETAKKVIDATGAKIEWIEAEAGDKCFKESGNPLPQKTLDLVREHKVALKAPITTPIGSGFRSVNVALRKEFDLYQNIRPAKTFKGVQSKYSNVDIVLFRENTDDLYVGIEFEQGKTETLELINQIKKLNGATLKEDSGISIKPISEFKTKRIVEAAYKYALEHNRKKIGIVTKANILKYSDGLFLKTARKIAEQFPQIESQEILVDNLCMQLVQHPEQFDMLVLPNLYGDIVSDLCAGLVGGLGMAPGANIGEHFAIFEAVHGSAPKYTGMNKMNPTALILSGKLMLEHLGEKSAAQKIEKAIEEVIFEGKNVTYDLKPNKQDPSAVGTTQMAQAIIDKL
ncbi:MAG: isocitrate/isopropylmalate dehydrogenase family protein [archaeon]|nr:isocitrate/isopropylmalate dehydrogenase family protein [archaeon]